jgi:hypothetical protein
MKTPCALLAAFAAALPLLASGCRPHLPPDATQLRDQFGVEIPAYWRAAGFSLEASELAGSHQEHFRGRFKATISLTTPTYVEDHRVGEVLFIRQVGRPGLRRTIYGRAEGTLASRGWNTRLSMENDPTRALGTPRDFFNAPRVIIAGSDDDRAFQAEQARELVETARQEEATRLGERQRQEDALIGEWHGSAFTERDARLIVQREGVGLGALFYNQGYLERLRVEVLAGNRILLTGISAVKMDGSRGNYNLDVLDIQLADDGILTGLARDSGGTQGGISMRKVLGGE